MARLIHRICDVASNGARLFGALCLIILSGCGAPTQSDLVPY
jgi:hypothetical protein